MYVGVARPCIYIMQVLDVEVWGIGAHRSDYILLV